MNSSSSVLRVTIGSSSLPGANTFGDDATQHAVAQRFDDIAAFDDRRHREAVLRAAVDFGDNHVLRDVDETARQVTGVRGLQRGIGQTFTRTVGRVEVLQDVQAFAEVRLDRRLDDRAVRTRHQAAHAGKLTDLRRATARAGVGHDEQRVHRLFLDRLALRVLHVVRADAVHHRLGDLLVGARPDVDHLVVALAGGDETRLVLLLDLGDFLLGAFEDVLLGGRDLHVVDADRHARARRVGEARVHELVGEHDRVLEAEAAVALVDQARDVLLGQLEVRERERQAVRQDFGQQRATDRGVDHFGLLDALAVLAELDLAQAHLHLRVQFDRAVVVGAMHFGDVRERHALALAVFQRAGHVVQAEHDVLRRHDDRFAVRGREDVVGRHHQRARFELRFERQRHVHGHLVAVEVRVERGTHERMQLDRLAFDEHRLERLDAEAVQRRRAVEQHRMFADHLFEDVPHLGALALDQLLRRLDRGGEAAALQLGEDERLEQFERHLLRQAALVQLERRADHDDRTAGVVDALAEQVLAEAALLALDHVGERLQRALVRARDRAAATAVVHQRIDRFLQHALFVAHDDVGRIEFEQALEAVVAVDDAAVQVVEVRRREAAAIERHQRTQIRRQHRQHGHDHPFRAVAGFEERLDELDALGQALELGLGIGRGDFLAQLDQFLVEVDRLEQLVDGLGAHARVELVAVLFDGLQVLFLVEDLAALERGHARIDDDVGFEVEDAFDVAQRHVEHEADARRQRLQEPDVRGRRGEFDVAHAFATHLGQRDFRAALFADDAAVLHALVLAAQALVVLDRAEDRRAEQAVAFGLERAVVDRLGLLHFAERPRTDQVRRGERDLDRVEIERLALLVEEIEQVFHFMSPLRRNSFVGGRGSKPKAEGRRCPPARARQRSSSSMLIASERISFTSTLKDSGMPATISWSPSTMFLYIWLRPDTSSDLTVSISCSVYAAP
jgi:hypothetical protein